MELNKLFEELINNGNSWDEIKSKFVMNPAFDRENASQQGKEDTVIVNNQKMQALVKYRDVLDFSVYKQAVRKIFPSDQFNLVGQVAGEIEDTAGGSKRFKTKYYEFVITNGPSAVPVSANTLEGRCIIKVNAPGSRTLTSDVDTSIHTRFEHREAFDFAHAAPAALNKNGPDYAGRVSNAIINQFYLINEEMQGVTSSVSRDSNAYADTITEDQWVYPKFGDELNPVIAGKHAFDPKQFYEKRQKGKQLKHVLEQAASLFSLRCALDDNEWQTFKTAALEQIAVNAKEFFKRDPDKNKVKNFTESSHTELKKVFDKVDQEGGLYKFYQTELTKKQEAIRASYYEKSTLHKLINEIKNNPQHTYADKLKKFEDLLSHDLEIAALNRLYFEYLEKVTDIKCRFSTLEEDNKSLITKLNDIHQQKEKKTKELAKLDANSDDDDVKETYDRIQKKVASFSNDFEERLKTLQENLNEILSLKAKLQETQIIANLFANEAYINRSAVYHVVKGQQQGGNVEISQQTMRGSALQQIGFKLLHGRELRKSKSVEETVYLTSKYGQRVFELIFSGRTNPLVKNENIDDIDDIAKGQELEGISLFNSLKDTKKIVPSVHVALKKEWLYLINMCQEIVMNVKRSKLPDSEKPKAALKLIQSFCTMLNKDVKNDFVRIEEELFLELASTIIALSYLSRLQHKTYLWGHGFFESEKKNVLGAESSASLSVDTASAQAASAARPPATNLIEEIQRLPEGAYTARSSGKVLTLAMGTGSRAATFDSHADSAGNAPATLSGNVSDEVAKTALQRGPGKKT
jgi:hypothetical protein